MTQDFSYGKMYDFTEWAGTADVFSFVNEKHKATLAFRMYEEIEYTFHTKQVSDQLADVVKSVFNSSDDKSTYWFNYILGQFPSGVNMSYLGSEEWGTVHEG